MTLAAFAMLLATSLLQPCACDMQASRAQVARKLKASLPASPRLDAGELRERVDRRLSMSMQTPSPECLAACPDLQSLVADITTASMPLMQSLQGGESGLDDMMELLAEITEITVDAYCAHRSAVQCVVDNPSACSGAVSEGIGQYASKLDCLCDACPSAKTALADFTGIFMDALVTGLSGFSGDGTTTQAFGADTSTDSDGLQDDMTDEELQMMCAVYPLLSCSANFPAQCGDDILLPGLNMSDMTTDSLAQMEGMCPSTDDDNENNNNGNSDAVVTSNCGPISPGWFSVSLLLAVAALTFEAV